MDNPGIFFAILLSFTLLILKGFGYIAIGWLWVLSPIWGLFVFCIAINLILYVVEWFES